MIAQKKKKTFKKLFAKNALMVKILSKCTKAAAASKAVIRNVSEQHFSCGSRHDQQLLELKAHRYQNTALKHEFTSGGVKHTQAWPQRGCSGLILTAQGLWNSTYTLLSCANTPTGMKRLGAAPSNSLRHSQIGYAGHWTSRLL